jgi:DNA-binding CsgD family transcriptional regulator
VWQYVHPDDVERLSQSLADALSQEVQTEQIVRLLNGPKTYQWFRIRGQTLIHPLTQDRHLIGTVEALPRTSRMLLTDREIEVLYLFAKDLTARGIAQNLGISPHTVNNHIRKIYAKLGANSRLEAMLKANSLGLLYL